MLPWGVLSTAEHSTRIQSTQLQRELDCLAAILCWLVLDWCIGVFKSFEIWVKKKLSGISYLFTFVNTVTTVSLSPLLLPTSYDTIAIVDVISIYF